MRKIKKHIPHDKLNSNSGVYGNCIQNALLLYSVTTAEKKWIEWEENKDYLCVWISEWQGRFEHIFKDE